MTTLTYKKPTVRVDERMTPMLIVIKCRASLIKAKAPQHVIQELMSEVVKKDFQHLLMTCNKYVNFGTED